MEITKVLAKHIREVFFGGNWTCSSLKEHLGGVSVEIANQKIDGLNSIATLMFHIAYYVKIQIEVLENGVLNGNDELSFQTPNFQSQEEWKNYLDSVWTNAEKYAQLVEKMPNEKLTETFVDEKYGNYLRNILGNIEHIHYHLGQIVIIKKQINA